MSPITGEWYTQSQRPILKVGRTVTADVEQGDVAACAVGQGSLASCAVEQGYIAACAVTCSALGALVVSSEKATTNLRTRSYESFIYPPEPSGLLSGGSSIGGWSTTYVLWRPLVPVTIKRVQAVIRTNYQHACNDSLTLYGNNGTSLGDVYFCGQSTAITGGTRVSGGNLNLVALAACTDLLCRYAASTCSIPVPISVLIDYETTN